MHTKICGIDGHYFFIKGIRWIVATCWQNLRKVSVNTLVPGVGNWIAPCPVIGDELSAGCIDLLRYDDHLVQKQIFPLHSFTISHFQLDWTTAVRMTRIKNITCAIWKTTLMNPDCCEICLAFKQTTSIQCRLNGRKPHFPTVGASACWGCIPHREQHRLLANAAGGRFAFRGLRTLLTAVNSNLK